MADEVLGNQGAVASDAGSETAGTGDAGQVSEGTETEGADDGADGYEHPSLKGTQFKTVADALKSRVEIEKLAGKHAHDLDLSNREKADLQRKLELIQQSTAPQGVKAAAAQKLLDDLKDPTKFYETHGKDPLGTHLGINKEWLQQDDTLDTIERSLYERGQRRQVMAAEYGKQEVQKFLDAHREAGLTAPSDEEQAKMSQLILQRPGTNMWQALALVRAQKPQAAASAPGTIEPSGRTKPSGDAGDADLSDMEKAAVALHKKLKLE
jgi:hypothetical protein